MSTLTFRRNRTLSPAAAGVAIAAAGAVLLAVELFRATGHAHRPRLDQLVIVALVATAVFTPPLGRVIGRVVAQLRTGFRPDARRRPPGPPPDAVPAFLPHGPRTPAPLAARAVPPRPTAHQ